MTSAAPPNQTPLHLRIFLASPGDVGDERALAQEILEQLQYDPFLRGRVNIETVAWDKPGSDTPMLATLTPQEAISLQRPKPSECDVVVVIFWSRMGTPLPKDWVKEDGGTYLSGTEWEYEDAVTASERDGCPRVLVYRRSEVPSAKFNDPHKAEKELQWARVEAFFASFKNPDGSIRRGFNEYATPEEFGKRLTEHLKEILKQLLAAHGANQEPTRPETDTAKVTDKIESSRAPLWEDSPFPGLRAFDESDAPIYFGRGRETDALVHRLTQGGRFIAVVGASGSGKSSLVAAGLLPRLHNNAVSDKGSRDWLTLRFAPGEVGDNPFIALLTGVKSILDNHRRRVRDEAAQIERTPAAFDECLTLALDDRPQWSELLIFVDQFEELFTVVAERYRAPFCSFLAYAAKHSRIRVVLTLRADFYHRCVDYPALAELLRTGSFPLAAPDRIALEEMITRPVERAGLVYDQGLPKRILDDTGDEPGALALMAFALSELYEEGKGTGRLSEAAYEAFGGVQGAVSKRAEDTYEGLDEEACATLAAVFRELVEVREAEGGWVATRRRAPLDKAAPTAPARRLVDAFVTSRLLVTDEDDEQSLVEVAHEALLRNWPRMVKLIEETGEDLWLLREFRRAAKDWARNERGSAFLWPRRRWRDAIKVIDRLRPILTGAEKPFLGACRQRSWMLGVSLTAVVMALGGAVTWLRYQEVPFLHAMTRVPVRAAWVPVKLGIHPKPEMVQVPAGSFQMGCLEKNPGCSSDELPIRTVTFGKPFLMGKYEVTYFEYLAFAHETERRIPDTSGWWPFSRPIINVDWEDATDYAAWLSAKTDSNCGLPTEAEWEYAARAGTTTAYAWGDEIGENRANCSACGSKWDGKSTAPVGSFEPNDWALHDMHGNVWEWVQDCWSEDYSKARSDGSAGCPRVLRGGSWLYDPEALRSAYRNWYNPDYRGGGIGFRVVCRPQSSH